MSFEYRKNKGHDNESFWTSYSDLFLGLSSIFLMLYVVASLRTGTDSIKFKTDNQKLQVEVQDLKNQLKSYETVKDNYIKTQASKNEMSEYNELMDKLVLLQDEAKSEKENLRKTALENERKEEALNKYQQMVRNVINANNLAKVKINNRNEVIDVKDQTIEVKDETITTLNTDINKMNQVVRQKEAEIVNVNTQLDRKMKELNYSLKKSKLTHKAYQAQMKRLKNEAQQSLTVIQSEKEQVAKNLNVMQQQLANTQQELQATSGELGKTKGALDKTKGALEAKGQEVAGLQGKINSISAENQAKIDALQDGFAAERAKARGSFEAELKKQKNLSGAEIARREAAFKKEGEEKERQLAGKINGLSGQLKDAEGKLAAAQAELNARKGIAGEIKKGFKAVGVKADVDMETGDVVLDFGEAYFENNSANLKEEMRRVLQKAMPVYSKSLFGNSKVADKVSAVEVIGFASPTYQGRVVDPYSTKPQDRQAIKYNMDLSYKRAKSIFNYLLDGENMNFAHHQELVPALKVSGRSFLDLMKTDRTIASAEDYCKKNDCKKSQRVIIRFNMDKKK